MKKYIYVVLAFMVAGMIFLIATTNKNPLHIYLIPENFEGEVEITFEQADYPPLKRENNTIIYNVPESGKLKTSTSMESGAVEVYYVDNQGNRIKVNNEYFHGVSSHSGGKDNETIAKFFIGTKEQYDHDLEQQ